MTNQNNAAQAAPQQTVLTREQIGELYKDWVCVFGVSTGSAELCIREIEAAVLSQLRAPVADDLVASLHSMASVAPTGECEILLAAASALASAPVTHYECGRSNGDGTYAAVPVRAPVAGEAVALRRDERLRETAANFLNAYRAHYGGVYGQIKKHAPLQDQVLALVFASREAPPADDAAPQASEAVRIQFPAHLRKMWSGGEVQAWLDEHQGVTPPKVSAKGSLERYRKWQAEREEAFGAGVKAAADLVKKTVEDYDANHGSTDCETGTREYPGEGATWVCEMQELEESIRALSAQAGAQRTGGCDAA